MQPSDTVGERSLSPWWRHGALLVMILKNLSNSREILVESECWMIVSFMRRSSAPKFKR